MLSPEQTLIALIQLVVALILGMILGVERLLSGRTAGPRTYGLVAVGACLATIISGQLVALYPDSHNVDPATMISAIITGIGFIGAGLIVFQQSRVSGLTTAAGIWVSAIIGISIGFKLYVLGVFATFLTLFAFSVVWRFEEKLKIRFGYTEDLKDEG